MKTKSTEVGDELGSFYQRRRGQQRQPHTDLVPESLTLDFAANATVLARRDSVVLVANLKTGNRNAASVHEQ